MAIPIAKQGTTPVVDALPAIKVRCFTNMPAGRQIYSYARLFATEAALMVSLTAFERHPPANSRIAVALSAADNHMLHITLRPDGTGGIHPLDAHGKPRPATMAEAEAVPIYRMRLPATPYSGEDEQGWYWGATITLGAPLLQRHGICLQDMARFGLAVYKYDADEPGYGCSLPAGKEAGPFDQSRFEECVIAPEGT